MRSAGDGGSNSSLFQDLLILPMEGPQNFPQLLEGAGHVFGVGGSVVLMLNMSAQGCGCWLGRKEEVAVE